MKGISQTIAGLMVVVIAVGLAMGAYAYSSGYVTRITSKAVEFVDASCSSEKGEIYITLRNTGLGQIRASDVVVSVDNVPLSPGPSWDRETIAESGGIAIGTVSGSFGGPHRVKIVNPVTQPQELVAAC